MSNSLRRGALRALRAVGELWAEMGIRCHPGDVWCYWSNLGWTRKGSCLTERETGLSMAQHSWFQWQQDRVFGAINPFLALDGSTAGAYVLYPCILLEKEGIKRTLEGTWAPWPRISICLPWLQALCTVQLISRVQPQTGCFLGWTSPHPALGLEQRDVRCLTFGKLFQVPHTCQRFWKSRIGSVALRTSIATAWSLKVAVCEQTAAQFLSFSALWFLWYTGKRYNVIRFSSS